MIKSSKRAQRSTPYKKKTGRLKMVRLDMMENPYGSAPSALKSLRSITEETVSAYPEYEMLIEALASHFRLPKESILVGNGSDEILQSVFDGFCNEEDKVLIPVPTFPIIPTAAQKCGAKITTINYNDDLSFPKEEFLKNLANNPKIAVIVSPNNPTGTTVDRNFILDTASHFPKTLFLVDEAYAEYSTNKSLIDEAPKRRNIIVVRTFSKAYGLAGLRCGWAVSSPEIIDVLNKLRAPYCVNSAAATAAKAALSDQKWLSQVVKKIRSERKRLKASLNLLGFRCTESDANFLLLYTGKNSRFITEALESHRILVKNLTDTHKLMEGVLRVTVGSEKDNRLLIRTLRSILPKSALILDVDGTLVDVCDSYHRVICDTVLNLTGERPSDREIYQLKSGSGYNDDIDIVCELCCRRGKSITYDEAEKVFNSLYEGSPIGTGAVKSEKLLIDVTLLKQLSEKFKLALFTGRTRLHLEFAIKRFGIERYFETILTLDEIPKTKRKPHPYGLFQIMKELGCKQGTYIGDIPDDVQCAKAAGLTAVGVVPPVRKKAIYRKALQEAGADFVLQNINDLRRVLYE